MKDEQLLQIVKRDLENAKEAKKEINEKIVEWRKLYSGDADKIEGRSNYVSKDAKKNIHWYIPSALKPFLSTDEMVEAIPQSADDVQRAQSQSMLLNYQFNNEFDRFTFIRQSIFIMASEGTVIARTGWEKEEEDIEQKFNGLTYEEVSVLEQNAVSIEATQGVDGLFSGMFKTKRIVIDRPTAEIIKNEDFFIAPDAMSIDKADYVIQKIETTISELRKQDKKYNPNGIYENVDKLLEFSTDGSDDILETDRENQLEKYGSSDDYESLDKSRKKVTIYEYYGNIDIDESGIAKPAVCVFSGNVILRKGKNPFPDKKPPFVSTPFSQQGFTFWGDALTEFIADVQGVKTAIMRTFIELMANSTNGMKHVKKGTIDAFNLKKLREAKVGTVVEWKDLTGYLPEAKNDIPQSLMSMYELFTGEGENESGITRYNQGLNAQSLNKTATGVTAILNQSQMRMWETTSQFAENYLKQLIRKWISYNQAWLSKEISVRVVGDEFVSIKPDDIGGKYDIQINVALAGSNEQKSQHIMQLFQTATPLAQGGIVPPMHLGKLFGKLEELWGFKDLSGELKQLISSQEQQQQIMQQQQMMQPQQQIPQEGM